MDDWVKVAFVSGFGTSNSPKTYSYSDNNVGRGTFEYRLKQISNDGKVLFSHPIEAMIGVAPNIFELMQNYPNPFNPSTTIEFTVPVSSIATVNVFNAIGQEVTTLYEGTANAGEYHHVQFTAGTLSSGMYFVRLQSGNKMQLKKMVLMK